MIPTVEEILKQIADGTMSLTEALAYIQRHSELDVDNAIAQYEADYDEVAATTDRTRTQLLCSVLGTVPPGAQSDAAAIYCWDVVARLMEMRERGLGKITAEMANELREPPPPAPETLEEKVARMEKAMAGAGLNQQDGAKTPYNPEQHKGPWTPKEVVDDSPPVATWGDGANYSETDNPDAKPEHDDGPF